LKGGEVPQFFILFEATSTTNLRRGLITGWSQNAAITKVEVKCCKPYVMFLGQYTILFEMCNTDPCLGFLKCAFLAIPKRY